MRRSRTENLMKPDQERYRVSSHGFIPVAGQNSTAASQGPNSYRVCTLRERWVLWHGILFEEPNPTGNRQSDLIGLLLKIPRGDIDGVGKVK